MKNFMLIRNGLIEKGEDTLLKAFIEFANNESIVSRTLREKGHWQLKTNLKNANKEARTVIEILLKRCCKLFKVSGDGMSGMFKSLAKIYCIPQNVINAIKRILDIGNTNTHQVGLDKRITRSTYNKIIADLTDVLMWYVKYAHTTADQFRRQTHKTEIPVNNTVNNYENQGYAHVNKPISFIIYRQSPNTLFYNDPTIPNTSHNYFAELMLQFERY